jgi:hypothetical protein
MKLVSPSRGTRIGLSPEATLSLAAIEITAPSKRSIIVRWPVSSGTAPIIDTLTPGGA